MIYCHISIGKKNGKKNHDATTDKQTVNDPLLQPLKPGHLTLKNRIMSTSHASVLLFRLNNRPPKLTPFPERFNRSKQAYINA